MSWDWEDTWQLIALLAICGLLAFLGGLVFAPKNVDYYYLSHGNGTNNAANCVYAHWTWHADEIAFCSDDKDRAIDFVTRANASLPKK